MFKPVDVLIEVPVGEVTVTNLAPQELPDHRQKADLVHRDGPRQVHEQIVVPLYLLDGELVL